MWGGDDLVVQYLTSDDSSWRDIAPLDINMAAVHLNKPILYVMETGFFFPQNAPYLDWNLLTNQKY